jgi:hypothetical protein
VDRIDPADAKKAEDITLSMTAYCYNNYTHTRKESEVRRAMA